MITNRKVYLILSGAVQSTGAPALIALSNIERRKMYFRAFKFYVDKLRNEGSKCGYDGVVFCDNSGADVSEFKELIAGMDNAEMLSAPPEIFPAYLGKNNDFNIVDYMMTHSRLLADPTCAVFKSNGRYFITNITDMIADVRRCRDEIDYYCELRKYTIPTLHGLHREDDAEARYLFATKDFWMKNFFEVYKRHPEPIAEECYVSRIGFANLKNPHCRCRFWREAYIDGDQFTSANAPSVRCWGLNLRPEVYFKIRAIRWRLETVMRHLVPWFWF